MKRLVVGIAVVALVIVAGLMVARARFDGSGGGGDMTGHHPFRSVAARERFLALYDRRAESWPVDADSWQVATSQGHTFVRVSGPEDGLPVVLLHGIGGNSLQWIENVEALSQTFRVYAVDALYDFGRSVYTEPLTEVADYTRWLDEILAALGLSGRANLVGLSYGGWLAAQYALRHPEHVRSLVLIAPVGTVLPLPAGWIVRAVLTALPHPYFTKGFLHWLAADLAARDDAGRRLVDEWAEEAYVAQRSFRRRPIAHPTVLSAGEWQALTMPVLFIVGENERIYDAAAAVDRLRDVAPHVHVESMAGAGHDIVVVHAEQVNRAVVRFVTDANADGARAGGRER